MHSCACEQADLAKALEKSAESHQQQIAALQEQIKQVEELLCARCAQSCPVLSCAHLLSS